MNDAITISIVGGAFATGALIVRYLFYSKCTSVQCCGCKITRDTVHEESHPDGTPSTHHETNQI